MSFETPRPAEEPARQPKRGESKLGHYVKSALVGAALSLGTQAGAAGERSAGEAVQAEKKEQVKRKMFAGEVTDPQHGRITIEVSEINGSGSFLESEHIEVLLNGQSRKILRFETRRDGGTRTVELAGSQAGEVVFLYFPVPQRREPATYRVTDAGSGKEITLPIDLTFSFHAPKGDLPK